MLEQDITNERKRVKRAKARLGAVPNDALVQELARRAAAAKAGVAAAWLPWRFSQLP